MMSRRLSFEPKQTTCIPTPITETLLFIELCIRHILMSGIDGAFILYMIMCTAFLTQLKTLLIHAVHLNLRTEESCTTGSLINSIYSNHMYMNMEDLILATMFCLKESSFNSQSKNVSVAGTTPDFLPLLVFKEEDILLRQLTTFVILFLQPEEAMILSQIQEYLSTASEITSRKEYPIVSAVLIPF